MTGEKAMLRFDIITIFPDMFAGVLDESIMKRAQEKKNFVFKVHDLRDNNREQQRK